MISPARTCRILLAGAALAVAPPALAATAPVTRLVDCGEATCLLVAGHRHDATAAVSINGHVVEAKGGRGWQALVPVATIREWSEPYARSISVAVAGSPAGAADASLPIGLLGHVTDLAFLEVRAR
jgi:hypothetical protein